MSGLEDTPHGAILHRPIVVAYVFHDLWPSVATAIFSFLAKVWTSSATVFFFFFPSPFQCCRWPLSGMTSPGCAGGFQDEWRTAGIKRLVWSLCSQVPDPPECVGSALNIDGY